MFPTRFHGISRKSLGLPYINVEYSENYPTERKQRVPTGSYGHSIAFCWDMKEIALVLGVFCYYFGEIHHIQFMV